MPIKINLLAESQAAEEARRRDPVKRAIWMGSFLVAAMLVWAGLLQARITLEKTNLRGFQTQIEKLDKNHKEAVKAQKQLADVQRKLDQLEKLSHSRFLTANMLNSVQKAMVENVHLIKMRTDVSYAITEAVKPRTNSTSVVAGKPAKSTEHIVLKLEAQDYSQNPGDGVSLYKEKLASLPYFERVLGETNEVRLTGLTPPQVDPDGQQYVTFTLECPYPAITR